MPTTGITLLPDVGVLSYNGVVFAPLYTSRMVGTKMPDAADRTVRAVEWALDVEAIVTLNKGDLTTDNTMVQLRQLLEQNAGTLTYSGKGLGNLVVNAPGGQLRDIAWGPKPKLLEFQPLGGSRSARVHWQCVTQIPELKNPLLQTNSPGGALTVVQFNEETALTYDDDQYSTVALRGTLEIALTRTTVNSRVVSDTVDSYRQRFLNLQVDLTRFRVTHREFNVSRDKRVMEWAFVVEELPPMGLPPNAVQARGTFTCDNEKKGPGMVQWICTLDCTYAIRKDASRRMAWWAFLTLLLFRMGQSRFGNINLPAQAPGPNPVVPAPGIPVIGPMSLIYKKLFGQAQPKPGDVTKCIIQSFGFREGMHLDSKTITFKASWRLFTTKDQLLRATGLWRWLPGSLGGQGNLAQVGAVGGGAGAAVLGTGDVWAIGVQEIVGAKSWLVNQLDPSADILVDLGGGP
jgi:hypothetical protein